MTNAGRLLKFLEQSVTSDSTHFFTPQTAHDSTSWWTEINKVNSSHSKRPAKVSLHTASGGQAHAKKQHTAIADLFQRNQLNKQYINAINW